MDVHKAFSDLLEKIELKETEVLDQDLLKKVFSDLDKVLNFSLMDETELGELLNCMAGIRTQIPLPDKKMRDQFFDSIGRMLNILEECKSNPLSTQWVDAKLYRTATVFSRKLKILYQYEKEWGPGRHQDLNSCQTIGIKKFHEILKKTQQRKKSAERWTGFKIKQIGQFTSQTTEADQMFKATPTRLISNFAKGLGMNIPEVAIEYAIKKRNQTSK